MLDELRELEAKSDGRVVVWHTLTDCGDVPTQQSVESAATTFSSALGSLPCRHRFFATPWKPFAPRAGPLQMSPGEEAGLRGRPSVEMLSTLLPPPDKAVKVVVSGPPQMWEDLRFMLVSVGHREQNLVELKALSAGQTAPAPCLSVRLTADEVTGACASCATDASARIAAAKGVVNDLDALLKKAAAGVAMPNSGSVAVAPSAQDAGSRKRDWVSSAGSWSWSGSQNSSSWRQGSTGWGAGWKESKWGA